MATLTNDARISRAILASNRPVPRGAQPPAPERMARHATLEVWFDPEHLFCPQSGTVVLRAIDDAGVFCWLIRQSQCRDGLSYAASPYDVVPPADEQAEMPLPVPSAVRDLALALRRGEIRFNLVAHDFAGLPGWSGWLGRLGMPGWFAAWLMPLAPEIGRAIWTAHRRSLEARQARLVAFRPALAA